MSRKYKFHDNDDNPVVAGFADNPEDWKYSSAKYFCEIQGLIKLSYS